MRTLKVKTKVDIPSDILWAWHAKRWAVSRLIPPHLPLEILREPRALEVGEQMKLRLKLPLYSPEAIFKISEVLPDHQTFIDEQVSGPFTMWRHEHIIKHKNQTSELIDTLHYRLTRFEWLNERLETTFRHRMKQLFRMRHHIASWDAYWLQHFPLKVTPQVFSLGPSRFTQQLHAFFSPINNPKNFPGASTWGATSRDKNARSIHSLRKHLHADYDRPHVLINALGGADAQRGFSKALTRCLDRLGQINPEKCVVLYNHPEHLTPLSVVELYCKFPLLVDCSALVQPKHFLLNSSLYRPRAPKKWLAPDHLLALIWLAFFDTTYSGHITPELDPQSSYPPTDHRYAHFVSKLGLDWKRYSRLYL